MSLQPGTNRLANMLEDHLKADAASFELVYGTLKRTAGRLLASRATRLQPTELVHEAWARLDGHTFAGVTHYQAVAALAMRQILVDHARAKQAQKRKGHEVTFTGLAGPEVGVDLIALHLALEKLERLDPRGYQVATLRYLGGMTAEEVAQHLRVSRRTVQSTWRITRAWLLQQVR